MGWGVVCVLIEALQEYFHVYVVKKKKITLIQFVQIDTVSPFTLWIKLSLKTDLRKL